MTQNNLKMKRIQIITVTNECEKRELINKSKICFAEEKKRAKLANLNRCKGEYANEIFNNMLLNLNISMK